MCGAPLRSENNEGGIDLDLSADGLDSVGVLNFTVLENLDLYGKLGAFFIDSDTDFGDFGDTETELYGGIGGQY